MNNKTLAVALFAAVMTVTIGMQPVYAQTATGSATIEPKTCGLVFDTGSSVDYGTLLNGAGAFDPSQTLLLNNTGNSGASIVLSGTNWVEQANNTNTVMFVNQTHFTTSGDIIDLASYDGATLLQETTAILPPISAGQLRPVNFGLLVTLIDNLFAGAISQSMTFTADCI